VEYEPTFEKSFMSRTLDIVNNYDGPYEATLLVNCLLGLLVLPKETVIQRIPAAPVASLNEWGIRPGSIKNPGTCEYGHQHDLNLRQLMRRMRNSIAHFDVKPIHREGEVEGYAFKDRNGFHVELSVSDIKLFVSKLLRHLLTRQLNTRHYATAAA
jgi:HEPN pEK499 p136